MFSVTSALALLGLLSLLIPLLIHLLNPGKGKLVWVGNIKLMQQAQKKSITEIRLQRWLLLLLRLLIFTLATLLAAQTFFHGNWGEQDKTLTLLAPSWIKQASEQQLNEVLSDSDNIKLLSGGFVTVDKTVIKRIQMNEEPKNGSRYSHWSLLSYLDQTRDKSETFVVYSSNSLSGFDYSLQAPLSRAVQWRGQWRGQSKGQSQEQLQPLDKTTMAAEYQPVVAVYTSSQQMLVRQYLAVGLNTIKTHRVPKLIVSWHSDTPDNMPPADWIIWLSDKTLPQALDHQVNEGSVLLQLNPNASQPSQQQTQQQTWKKAGKGLIYQVSDWDSWVLQADFANQLLARMTALQPLTTRFESPRLSEAQMQPALAQLQADEKEQKTPLQTVLILLLIGCWILERLLSEYGQDKG